MDSKANDTYTAKLSPEVKEEWKNLINKIQKEQGYKTVAEVYPVLINTILSNTTFIAPDLSSYIQAIRTNLEAISRDVLAIQGVYKSALDNQDKAIQEAKATIQAHLEQEIQKNEALAEELDKTKGELDQAKELIKSLEAENRRLKENQNIQDKMLKILEQLQENSKEETATDPETAE